MSDAVARLNAALSGRYRVERQLGEGGMATVYLASDLKHDRKVALKVLKPELAAVVGAERFLAEIRTTANLQHPHVLPLHDSGEADGLLFYVMPFIEGETLRDRLDREHQLPVDEAVRIATNVAEALDYAHRHGVIHRDIKPANILLVDGKPVVADFGIALAVTSGSAGRMTETGLSLGTPHYMSPEQATGDVHVGPATDIWALGCVLYEMLAGEPPYAASTPQAVLGKIITAEPPSVVEVRKSVPPNVDAAIRKALEKVPADRFGSGDQMVQALGDTRFRHGDDALLAGAPNRGQWQSLALAFVVLVAVGAGLTWMAQREQQPPSPTTRASVRLRAGQELTDKGQLAISDDGTLIVYEGVAEGIGNTQLWARRIDALEAVPVAGTVRRRTVGPDQSISPDGREVVVRDEQAIRVFPLSGGVPRTLVDDPAASRPDWSPDGRWIYFTDSNGGISRVSAEGGPTEVVTNGTDAAHHFVDVLPDGRGAVIEIRPGRLGVIDIESGDVRDIGPGEFPRYAGGYLFYQAGDFGTTLVATPFDPERRVPTGRPFTIAEGLPRTTGGNQRFAISSIGTLLYEIGASIDGAPVIVDRQGVVTPVDRTWTGDFGGPVLSSDGTRLAVYSAEAVWVYNLRSRVPTRIAELPRPPALAATPSWTPDGRSVVFVSESPGLIYSQRADGASEPQALYSRRVDGLKATWSAAGDFLIFTTAFPPARDIVALPAGDSTAVLIVATASEESQPALTFNGEWLAYVSVESDRPEVFVRSFHDASRDRVQISTGGGQFPLWSPTGSEIFYSDLSRDFISVRLGPDMEIVERRTLFSRQDFAVISDVMPDGDRFLASLRPGGVVEELVLVLNVIQELDRLTTN
jgi:serine/threonine-protein kinase